MSNPRDLRYCSCDTCGSSLEVNYDKANDKYICMECLENEDKTLELRTFRKSEEDFFLFI